MNNFSHLLVISIAVQFSAAFIPSSVRNVPHWGRPALIFSPDGERYHEDDYFLQEERQESESATSLHHEIIEYLNQPQFIGPLGMLAAAKAEVDLASIHLVKVARIDPRFLQIAATSCDNMSCVNLLLDLYFPNPRDSLCQHHVIEELGVLYQQASAILASRDSQAQILKVRNDLLQEKVVSFPNWWLHDMEQSLHDAALDLRTVLNEDSAYGEDLKELVIRHQAEAFHSNDHKKFLLANVEFAIVRKVGRNGIILGATDGKRQIHVPIRFPKQANTVDELQELVLATIEKGNRYFEMDQQQEQGIVETSIEDAKSLTTNNENIADLSSDKDIDNMEDSALFGVHTETQRITNDGDEDKEAELSSREVDNQLIVAAVSFREQEEKSRSGQETAAEQRLLLDDQEFFGFYVSAPRIKYLDSLPSHSGNLETEKQSVIIKGENSDGHDSYTGLEEIQTSTEDETLPSDHACMAWEKMLQEIESIAETPILERIFKKFARTVKAVAKTKR